jgi:hypothetical protein
VALGRGYRAWSVVGRRRYAEDIHSRKWRRFAARFRCVFCARERPQPLLFPATGPGLSQLAMLTEVYSKITGIATIGYPLCSLNV